jgi:hypothetical protein
MNILKLAAQLTLDGSRFKAGMKEAEVAVTRFRQRCDRLNQRRTRRGIPVEPYPA